jgi:cell division protein FtsW
LTVSEFTSRPRCPGSAICADRLFIICVILSVIGLIMLMSAGAFLPTAGSDGYHSDPYRLVKRQAICLMIALAIYSVLRRVPFETLDRLARIGIVLAVIPLVLVLVPGIGTVEGSARRWFRVGSISIQPSEFAKLALILFLAHYLTHYRHRLSDFRRGVLPPVGVVLLLAGLVALEPDVGTAVLLASIGFMMLLVAGLRVRHLFPFACVGLPALVGLLAIKFEHILPRIKAWLDPMSCYQTRQSLLALGSGHLFGQGLGEGRQKLAFLPQIHGDFLFASIGEELGLVGSLAVVTLFVGLIVFSVRLLSQVRDPFRFFVGVGVVGLIGLQAAINIAVVTASVPPKGIALPFISQGGTSLLVMWGGLALLVGAGEVAATTDIGARNPDSSRSRPGRLQFTTE